MEGAICCWLDVSDEDVVVGLFVRVDFVIAVVGLLKKVVLHLSNIITIQKDQSTLEILENIYDGSYKMFLGAMVSY